MENTELELSYEEDYRIEDPAFPEAFIVKRAMNAGRKAWWNGEEGKGKLERFIQACKMDFTVHESCIYAAISYESYRSFCVVHPEFPQLKARLKGILAIAAKQGLVADIAHPSGFRSRQWYLERKQPKLYGRPHEIPQLPADTTSLTSIVQRAFTGEDGKSTLETTATRIEKQP